MYSHHQGALYQHGYGLGSIFGGLIKRIIPAAKSFFKSSAGKTIKEIGASTAQNLVKDILGGKNVKQSAGENLAEAKTKLTNLIKRKASKLVESDSEEEAPLSKKTRKTHKGPRYKRVQLNPKKRRYNLLKND